MPTYKLMSPITHAVLPATQQVNAEVASLLSLCKVPISRQILQEKLNLRHAEYFRKAYILPALKDGLIEMTIPDKPKSRLQKYRLTEKGKAWL